MESTKVASIAVCLSITLLYLQTKSHLLKSLLCTYSTSPNVNPRLLVCSPPKSISSNNSAFSSTKNYFLHSSLRQHRSSIRTHREEKRRIEMSDWGPVFVSVVLFILLTPGLLIQVPGRNRFVEFGNFQTSGLSILIHSIIYFALICIFLLAIQVHVYIG